MFCIIAVIQQRTSKEKFYKTSIIVTKAEYLRKHTPGSERESTISSLAPKCFTSALDKVS